jgi:hypothetical protein
LLINVFADVSREGSIQGLTKLAKLDFLLRYPSNLERALSARGSKPEDADVQDYERTNVEARMVRYKYGPWDFRYRRFINLLVAKGLVHVFVQGRTIHLGITAAGRETAERLAQDSSFHSIQHRSVLLKRHVDLSATNLMHFIYRTFPEISNLAFGETINDL